MRIGIDARFFGGEQSKGIGRYTQKLIEQLAKHDTENEYVVFLQPESVQQWHIIAPNFTTITAPYRWYTLAEQLHMPRLIHKARVDLMHFPHFNVPLLYREPFIVTIHDLIILHFPTERATTLGPLLYAVKQWAGERVLRHAVKSSRHIITVSEFSKQDIVQYFHLDPQKVSVTHEAVDHAQRCEPAQRMKATMQHYHITKPYVLYVGNAYPHKNVEILFAVIEELCRRGTPPKWQLVLVGKMDYFYERLRRDAQARRLDQYIVFTDFVPDADLPCLYAAADAYIFPSLYEGFGLPALEAMSYGIPVLAARSSCLPEVLGDAALYFNPQDVSGIIHAIQRILHSQSDREQYIGAGKKQIQHYSWEHTMRKTLEMYIRYVKTTT